MLAYLFLPRARLSEASTLPLIPNIRPMPLTKVMTGLLILTAVMVSLPTSRPTKMPSATTYNTGNHNW